MATRNINQNSRGCRRILTTLVLSLCLATPGLVRADVNDKVSLGFGFHATIHRAVSYEEGNAMAGGAQVRLRLAKHFSIRLEYDFAQDLVANVDEATTLAQLVPYPDIQGGIGIYPVPNKYLSPYLMGGIGFNTGTGVSVPVFYGGLGLETTFFKHWVLGASCKVFYATAGRYSRFLDNQQEGATNYGLMDFIKPHTYQVNVELTYYL